MAFVDYQKWAPPIALITSIVWFVCAYIFEVPDPPLGAYIAVLGLVAVIVAIWPPQHKWSKAAWLLIFFLFTFFEIHNSYRARNKQDEEQAEARKEERKAFEAIADGLTTSMTNNQKAFDATMARMEALAELSKTNINESTGGDSFCYVDMGGVVEGLMALVVQKGRYPLFNVRVTITDLDAFDTALKSGTLSAGSFRRRFPQIDFLTRASLFNPLTVYPVEPNAEYKRYNAEIFARNGAFTELLRLKKTQGWWLDMGDAG
jgi:hypothetical protein